MPKLTVAEFMSLDNVVQDVGAAYCLIPATASRSGRRTSSGRKRSPSS
jgi:hypothetical protein